MRSHVVSCFISPLVVFLTSVPAVRGGAGEVGFTEDFALSPDRSAVLKQLIPGTEEYYFYSCLSGQLTGKLDEVDRILPQWIDRHGRTSRVEEIENRQALLRYPQDHRGSLTAIRRRLGLDFNHQREVLDAVSYTHLTLPTILRV